MDRCSNMHESQKHSVEWQKPDTNEYMMYDSIGAQEGAE